MALTLAIIPGSYNNGVAGVPVNLVAKVTNSGGSDVTLKSLTVSATPGVASNIGQPVFMTQGTPWDTAAPTLTAGQTYYYPFQVILEAPMYPGPSPQQIGGAAGGGAQTVVSSEASVTLQSLSSDGSTAGVSLALPMLSVIAPFPVPTGGTLSLNSGSNLVNFLTSFA